MSLQDREELTTNLVSENHFSIRFIGYKSIMERFIAIGINIQDSIIEFIDVDGVSSGKAAYTYKSK